MISLLGIFHVAMQNFEYTDAHLVITFSPLLASRVQRIMKYFRDFQNNITELRKNISKLKLEESASLGIGKRMTQRGFKFCTKLT